MLDRKEVNNWLQDYLSTWPLIEAHVFGSITTDSATQPADVDLFIKYNRTDVAAVSKLKSYIEIDFFRYFNYKLHLLLLSEEEADESRDFLKRTLKNSILVWRK